MKNENRVLRAHLFQQSGCCMRIEARKDIISLAKKAGGERRKFVNCARGLWGQFLNLRLNSNFKHVIPYLRCTSCSKWM